MITTREVALAALIEAGGSSPETARSVAHLLENLDPVELVAAVEDRDSSLAAGTSGRRSFTTNERRSTSESASHNVA